VRTGPVLVRAPLRPIAAAGASGEAPGEVLARARGDALLREALAVATVSAAGALDEPGDNLRLAATMRAFERRMAYRTTPFGLFAGAAIAGFGPRPRAVLGGVRRAVTAPSAASVAALVRELESRDEVLSTLRIDLTAAVVTASGAVVAHGAVADPDGGHARWVSSRLPAGLPPALLRGEVRQLPLLRRLLDLGVVVTELTPPPGHPDPLEHLRERLRAAGAPESAGRWLDELTELQRSYQATSVGSGGAALARFAAALPGSGARPGVRADVFLHGDIELPESVRDDAETAAGLLWRLRTRTEAHRGLDEYRTRFLDRYGVGGTVALLDVLDPAVGLGPPTHHLGAPSPQPDPEEASAIRRRRLLLGDLATGAVREGRREVVLTDADLAALTAGGRTDPVRSADVLAALAATGDDLRQGKYLMVEPRLGGGPAGAVMARLVPAGDELRGLVALLGDERREVVEVCFRPMSLAAADALAPLGWTARHIPVNARFDGSPALPVAQLGLSADRGGWRVSCMRTGAEVVPMSFSAVMPAAMPPVARFLVELGGLNDPYQDWWVPYAESSSFRPRLRHGRIVLRSARWLLPPGLCRDAASPAVGEKAWTAAVREWQDRVAAPQVVHIGRGDRRLPLDLTDRLDLRIARREIRRGAFEVVEPPGADGWLTGERGVHRGEIVVPVARPVPPSTVYAAPASEVTLRFPPGSGWLDVRVRTPRQLHPRVLAALPGVLTGLPVEAWYFVRYREDAHEQVRIRFRGDPGGLLGAVLPALTSWVDGLRGERLADTLSLHTYEPEVHRYGGAELHRVYTDAFHADSLCALDRFGDVGAAAAGVVAILRAFDPTGCAAAFLPRLRGHAGRERAAVRELVGAGATTPAQHLRAKAFGDYGRAVPYDDGTAIAEIGRSLAHMHCNRVLGPGSPLESAALLLARDTSIATGWLRPPTAPSRRN
jgi:thiopeptide-type bacteriocin biosynthesis protein